MTVLALILRTYITKKSAACLVFILGLANNLAFANTQLHAQYISEQDVAYTERVSLFDAIQRAKAKSPDYEIAQLNINNKSYEYLAAYSQFKPKINFNTNFSRTNRRYFGRHIRRNTSFDPVSQQQITTEQDSAKFDNSFYGVNLDWKLFDKKIDSQLDQLSLEQQLQDVFFEKAHLLLKQEITSLYIEALLSKRLVNQAYGRDQLANANYNKVRSQLHYGAATIVDRDLARSEKNNAEAELILAKSESRTSFEKLKSRIGPFNELEAFPAYLLNDHILSYSIDSLKTSAINAHPDIQAAALAVEIANKEIEKTRAVYFPELSATASLGRNTSTTDSNPAPVSSTSYDSSFGLNLSIPLYTGGSQTAQRHINQTQIRIKDAEHRKAIVEVENQVDDLYWKLRSLKKQLDANNVAIKASQTKLTGAIKGKKLGIRTDSDILTARKELTDAKTERIKTQFAYYIDLVNLYLLTGLQSQ